MKRETAFESYILGQRAIVVGSGLGGLSAARALSGRFRQVVILDRDDLPDVATPRPSVPLDVALFQVAEGMKFDWPESLPVERIKTGISEIALPFILFGALLAAFRKFLSKPRR